MPEVRSVADGIQLERIAALRPDRNVALLSTIDQGEYEPLARIWPRPPNTPTWAYRGGH
ncbi:MAG: hypothetical protein ACRD0K_28030 [Egibacteraceae bacterium]